MFYKYLQRKVLLMYISNIKEVSPSYKDEGISLGYAITLNYQIGSNEDLLLLELY